MKKIKRRIKWKNVFLLLFILACIIIVICSLISLIKWFYSVHKNNSQIKTVQNIVEVVETIDTEETEIIVQEDISKDSPYWKYIEMNLINVDFEELKKINNSTVGWIQVNGTNINYPFVQTDNNEFYLDHAFDKSYNSAGWVFMDYRNDITIDKNTILYAHSMKNKTMFGSLKNILNDEWLKNTDNHIIKISTEAENSLWQVFSIYHIETTTDYLQTSFISDDTFYDFANMLLNRSNFVFNTSISKEDRILTLSTCYSDTEKMVLHAKLIKKENKKDTVN